MRGKAVQEGAIPFGADLVHMPLCPVGPGQGDHRGCGGAREGVQMLWTELCPPKSTAALTPHPDTVVRDEAFEEGIKVK